MTESDVSAALDREARVFTSALIGETPSDYVIAQYQKAHAHLALTPRGRFDRTLVRFAVAGTLATRAADAYARVLRRDAALRRKLVTLVAILESSAPSDAAFASTPRSVAGVLLRLALTGAGFALALGAGALLLGPLHLAASIGGGE